MSKVEDFKTDALNTVESILREDGDVERALDWLERHDACDKNKGYLTSRLSDPNLNLEKAFAQVWEERNLPYPQINNGRGILQDILSQSDIEVTDRERKIVATMIQWLGSNVGQGFLHEVLHKCDMKIVNIKNQTEKK